MRDENRRARTSFLGLVLPVWLGMLLAASAQAGPTYDYVGNDFNYYDSAGVELPSPSLDNITATIELAGPIPTSGGLVNYTDDVVNFAVGINGPGAYTATPLNSYLQEFEAGPITWLGYNVYAISDWYLSIETSDGGIISCSNVNVDAGTCSGPPNYSAAMDEDYSITPLQAAFSNYNEPGQFDESCDFPYLLCTSYYDVQPGAQVDPVSSGLTLPSGVSLIPSHGVPEPGNWALMGLGLAALGAVARKRIAREQPRSSAL